MKRGLADRERCKHDNPLTGENACPECAPPYQRGLAERDAEVARLREAGQSDYS